MDCGLVLEEHISSSGRSLPSLPLPIPLRFGPMDRRAYENPRNRRFKTWMNFDRFLYPSDEYPDRNRVRDTLEHFGMDNRYLVDRIMHNFDYVYTCRVRGKDPVMTPSQHKKNVAMAFSIINVLAREKVPRPVEYILNMFEGVTIGDVYNVHRDFADRWNEPWGCGFDADTYKYELLVIPHMPPQDFIDTVCSYQKPKVPYKLVQEMYEVAKKANWRHFGRYSTVVAAASIQHVWKRHGLADSTKFKELCSALNCTPRSVRALENLLV